MGVENEGTPWRISCQRQRAQAQRLGCPLKMDTLTAAPSPHLCNLVVVGRLQLWPARLLGVRDVLAQHLLRQHIGVAGGGGGAAGSGAGWQGAAVCN